MIKARVYAGSTVVAIFVAILCLDHAFSTDVGLLAVVLALACAGLLEFYSLVEKKGCATFRSIGLIGAVAYVLTQWHGLRSGGAESPYGSLVVTAFVFAVFWAQGLRYKTDDAVRNISAALFGFVYIPYLGSYVLRLRHLTLDGVVVGEKAFVTCVLIAKAVDTGAYFVGRRLGRTKMSPRVSPKKTVEGLIGGLLAGLLVGVILYQFEVMRLAPLGWTMVVSLAIGVSGQLGDLAESMIKRDVEVKDSSGLLPGLGGVLDIIDCLLVAVPVTYYLLLYGPKL